MKNLTNPFLAAIALLWAASAHAGPEVSELATVTGATVAAVSAKLGDYQRQSIASAKNRMELIISVHRLTAEAQQKIDRELVILKNTGGSEIVKLLSQLQEHGNRVTAEPAQLDTAQADVAAATATAYKPLAIATDKLDAVAKNLAQLGTEKTSGERLGALKSFLSETRGEVGKLEKSAATKKAEADARLANAAKADAASLDAAVKKSL